MAYLANLANTYSQAVLLQQPRTNYAKKGSSKRPAANLHANEAQNTLVAKMAVLLEENVLVANEDVPLASSDYQRGHASLTVDGRKVGSLYIYMIYTLFPMQQIYHSPQLSEAQLLSRRKQHPVSKGYSRIFGHGEGKIP